MDLEIISSRGDINGLVARVGGILLGLSLTMVLVLVTPYWRTTLPLSKLTSQLWNDEEFLISITLAAAGMFSVLAWNHVMPDRRDCLVLGTLPVRTRTIALARLAAILTCIGVIVVAVNSFVGLTFPYVTAKGTWESITPTSVKGVALGAVIVTADAEPPKNTIGLGFPSVPMAICWLAAWPAGRAAGFINFGPSFATTKAITCISFGTRRKVSLNRSSRRD